VIAESKEVAFFSLSDSVQNIFLSLLTALPSKEKEIKKIMAILAIEQELSNSASMPDFLKGYIEKELTSKKFLALGFCRYL
jgi:hypothetical protein